MKDRFEARYATGDLPWNINRADFNLTKVVREYPVKPCKALDIGCGTGDNIIWLAKNGFNSSGIDISTTAVEMAKQKIKENGVDAPVHCLDFLKEDIPGNPFGFIFDRGCFHSFAEKEERTTFVENVYRILNKGGLWLSLIGNYDDGRLDIGPPKRTALEVIEVVEPKFEIILLKSGIFDSEDIIPSKIWICLMKKREMGSYDI